MSLSLQGHHARHVAPPRPPRPKPPRPHLPPRTSSSTRRYFIYVSSRPIVCHIYLRRMLLIKHIAEKGQGLVIRHSHGSPGQLNLQLSLSRDEEICFHLDHKHTNLHGIRMHNLTLSFNLCIECTCAELFLKLGPPHMWRLLMTSSASPMSIAWMPTPF